MIPYGIVSSSYYFSSGGGGGTGWIATLGALGSIGTNYLLDVSTDTNGNVCVIGTYANDSRTLLAKFDSNGIISWSRLLSNSTKAIDTNSIATYNSDIYITDNLWGTGVPNQDILKFDQNGTIQWQMSHGGDTDDFDTGGLDIDSSGNIVTTGISYNYPGKLVNLKINSTNGSLIRQSGTSESGIRNIGIKIAVGSNDYTYSCVNRYNFSTGASDFRLYFQTDSINWGRIYKNDNYEITSEDIHVDSSGNVYVIISAFDTNTGEGTCILAKFYSNGDMIWELTLGDSGNYSYGYSLAEDSEGYIYALWGSDSYLSQGTDTNQIISKIDSDGTEIWQRSLTWYNIDTGIWYPSLYSIAVYGNNIYAVGNNYYPENLTSSASQCMIVRLPTDGTLVNVTHEGFTIQETTFTTSLANGYSGILAEVTDSYDYATLSYQYDPSSFTFNTTTLASSFNTVP